jgi:hypothetical protein
MTQTTIVLDLPDELARRASEEGLLTPDAVAQLLRAEIERRRRPSTLSRARGLLSGEGPPPSDAEVARWLEERRTERYG